MGVPPGASSDGRPVPRAGSQGAPSPGFKQSTARTLAELGIVVLALLLVLLGARGCAGCASVAIVSQLPPSVDAAIGKAAAESMRAQYGTKGPATPEQIRRVEAIFDGLRETLKPEEATILGNPRVTVVVDPTVNAFALPGGEVFVLTGLLDRAQEDDDIVRGVLAHELGHAVHRHGVRGIVRSAAFGILVSMILGDLDSLTATVVGGASQLTHLENSRSMEEEADAFGIELLGRGGHSPEGLAKFLEGLDAHPIPELLSTHPDPAGRAKAIRERTGR
jgi:predicted Zn-dependent protease